ncbi:MULTISPECIES: hypothetical protein [unclassified Mycolicibacterium]|uniref:hypothetical protein n=1 Tax=unclassified Mycolicibacterium TaxID=2636767 RepID=UPI0012DEB610|nr:MULTISPECIES: hypothetical protein [unclassified Mycolicibacterium]MUL84331.1 hypothetical protein [Mycolicibacterium sp. CBMA 329]MUL89603.1 hypothetical protein [Mycolicibacterium sp. CBMA 331]MUL99779.1 hypothetical protein [Mycolicibacterium sp. CBMA 334]MUM29582.1 hypothetical protein [Mycolicibacterium sp. CBMA 295]MUM39118.1 hypothetical protein [Mycolicibacterium sp. CBMA 247]
MSTVDPAEVRRRRDAARRGSPSSLAWIFVWDVVVVAGAVLLARAQYAFAEMSADMSSPPWSTAGWVGLPLVLLGLLGHFGAARRYTGKLLGSPFIGPVPLMLIGFAIGTWWGWSSVPGTWMWVPLATTALAAVCVVAAVIARSRRRSRAGVLGALLAGGRIVPGAITDIAEIEPSSGGLIGPVTVMFTDSEGVDRWVTKTGQWRRADLPKNGDAAAVLFDPADPANTRRIWVGPSGSRTGEDFSRWNV